MVSKRPRLPKITAKLNKPFFRNPGLVDLRGYGYIQAMPADMDPDKFYRENYKSAKKKATGVEALVYAYIPYSVIKSFAIAIDPTAKFKAVNHKISLANRTRVRTNDNLLRLRQYVRRNRKTIYSKQPNYGGQLAHFGPVDTLNSSGILSQGALSPQAALKSTTVDTTSRTRPIGSDYGEFEHFKYSIISPSRMVFSTYHSRITQTYPDSQQSLSGEDSETFSEIRGPAATLSQGSIDAIRNTERTYASNLISKNAARMLSDIMPTSRRFSLFRELVELKDLPRSISQLRETTGNLRSTFDSMYKSKDLSKILSYSRTSLKDIPKEYVSYHFGWKQIFKAISDLLDEPAKIAARVNYLEKRSGQPTTHRLRRKIHSDVGVNPPAFFYDSLAPEEYSRTQTDASKRESELRMVINLTFDFPKVSIPRFKRDLFRQKLGAYPSFTDLYNLTPWTWLIDWFTGLGNYVSAMDIINTDPSIVNYGFITCVTRGETSSTHRSKSARLWSEKHDGISVTSDSEVTNTHTSKLLYTFQLRKALGSAYGVKSLAEPTSLTLYQQSILGALLANRTPTRKSPALRGD